MKKKPNKKLAKLLRKKKCKYQHVWNDIDIKDQEFTCLLHVPKRCDCMGNEEHCTEGVPI